MTGTTNVRDLPREAGQKSSLIALKAGRRYFFEVLHKEGTGADHFAVGWSKPGESTATATEVVPSYALSSYSAVTSQSGQERLYLAILSPQSTVASAGSGTSILTLAADERSATLTVQYSNLSTPFLSAHVHDASRGGAIIFDLDSTTPINGIYQWTFAQTGGISIADIADQRARLCERSHCALSRRRNPGRLPLRAGLSELHSACRAARASGRTAHGERCLTFPPPGDVRADARRDRARAVHRLRRLAQ